MTNRFADWLRQAEADLRHARNALESGDHEWACFAAQQGAEKAVGFDAGAPTDYYTREEGERAIDDAARILQFCRGALG